jgi:hypothetical protein
MFCSRQASILTNTNTTFQALQLRVQKILLEKLVLYIYLCYHIAKIWYGLN